MNSETNAKLDDYRRLAEIAAKRNGHELGKWTPEQNGQVMARCKDCGRHIVAVLNAGDRSRVHVLGGCSERECKV